MTLTRQSGNVMNDRLVPYACGIAMSINFLFIWAIPIMGMGASWKFLLKPLLLPIYKFIDESRVARSFAENCIYTKKESADYFAISLLLVLSSSISLGVVFYTQLTTGSLPWWLIALYYFSWVGVGGRIMGASYALAHKEGHNHTLYKKWIRKYVGHFFENYLGLFFGNVPYNFSTSHIFIHHRLDGGKGDTFYEWDIDRTSISDFMLYVYRIFLHMVGYSSLKFFEANNIKGKGELLKKGIIMYWATAAAILFVTRSFTFLFWIYFQPFLCMSFFLALINIGFHGFNEVDSEGKSIPVVNASTIIDGDDDYFGEDDHMAHHYSTAVFYRDIPKYQESKVEEYKKYKASVFRGLSIIELSIFILFSLWDKLADHYVDYSGEMTRDEIKTMLKTRAQRKEMSYEIYSSYLANPTVEARMSLSNDQSDHSKSE